MLWLATVALLAANPHLEVGEDLYERMLYKEASVHLQRATEVSTSTTLERRKAHELLAKAYLALGDSESAARTLLALLAADPRAPMPNDASPTLRRLFLEAKERLYEHNFVQLKRVYSADRRISAELIDPWEHVTQVELREAAANGPYRVTVLKPAELLTLELQPESSRYFFRALDAEGKEVSALGSEAAPILVDSAATTQVNEGAVKSRWPLWVGVGASVAMLIAGTGLALSAQADSQTAGRQPFASDIRRYDDAAFAKGVAGTVLLGVGGAGGITSGILFITW
ncbi:MAG: hypothetical protein K1X64_07300 [Myxococcaceae bacterium]|nr:hypothetical protein [Myxococcaceae bacterium]